eukprot:TRINITY_DN2262_c0_g1_i1.p1 TRINITY_DN2262_c0_g1~~TRINITY_DN2262_c0_g1_i1.p1  ORF type:complete len:896 (-),score=207.51 TRINITY_DN2262_c0_g1_i1:145-2832(-)
MFRNDEQQQLFCELLEMLTQVVFRLSLNDPSYDDANKWQIDVGRVMPPVKRVGSTVAIPVSAARVSSAAGSLTGTPQSAQSVQSVQSFPSSQSVQSVRQPEAELPVAVPLNLHQSPTPVAAEPLPSLQQLSMAFLNDIPPPDTGSPLKRTAPELMTSASVIDTELSAQFGAVAFPTPPTMMPDVTSMPPPPARKFTATAAAVVATVTPTAAPAPSVTATPTPDAVIPATTTIIPPAVTTVSTSVPSSPTPTATQVDELVVVRTGKRGKRSRSRRVVDIDEGAGKSGDELQQAAATAAAEAERVRLEAEERARIEAARVKEEQARFQREQEEMKARELEEARQRAERAEEERIAEEQARAAEQERLRQDARRQAEDERIQREAELARQQAEQARIQREAKAARQLEEERLAAEKDAAQRAAAAAEKAATEKAAAERAAAAKAATLAAQAKAAADREAEAERLRQEDARQRQEEREQRDIQARQAQEAEQQAAEQQQVEAATAAAVPSAETDDSESTSIPRPVQASELDRIMERTMSRASDLSTDDELRMLREQLERTRSELALLKQQQEVAPTPPPVTTPSISENESKDNASLTLSTPSHSPSLSTLVEPVQSVSPLASPASPRGRAPSPVKIPTGEFDPTAPQLVTTVFTKRAPSEQQGKCYQCGDLLPTSVFATTRFCWYSGRHYCEKCHVFETAIIPARVLHLWDFRPQYVCTVAKDYIEFISGEPVLNVSANNPELFNKVKPLKAVRQMRERLRMMGDYILTCGRQKAELMNIIAGREYFLSYEDFYSLHDLVDVNDGSLLPKLQQIAAEYEKHIAKSCDLCQRRGHYCDFCSSKDLIYPFQTDVVSQCDKCLSYFHSNCFMEGVCVMCARRSAMKRASRKMPETSIDGVTR